MMKARFFTVCVAQKQNKTTTTKKKKTIRAHTQTYKLVHALTQKRVGCILESKHTKKRKFVRAFDV